MTRLTQAAAGEDVADALRALIDEHKATREWAKNYLRPRPVLRGYSPLPGLIGAISAQLRYVCPQCDYIWICRQAGEEVPDCPNHLIPLVPGTA